MGSSFVNKYRQYLRSDKWQVIRKRRLAFDSGECVACGKKSTDVHHKRYPKVWGTESIKDLASMCRDCHDKQHGHNIVTFDEDTMLIYTVNDMVAEIVGVSNSLSGVIEFCDKNMGKGLSVGTRESYNKLITELSKEDR